MLQRRESNPRPRGTTDCSTLQRSRHSPITTATRLVIALSQCLDRWPVDRTGSGLHWAGLCAVSMLPCVSTALPLDVPTDATGWTLRPRTPSSNNAHAVEVAGLSRPPCLNHHSPPVGRAISVCRRKRPGSRFAAGFPVPCGVMLRHHCLMPGCLFMRQMSHKPS